MVRIGILSDTHIRPAEATYTYKDQLKQHMADALDYLRNTAQVDLLVFGGDLVHPDGTAPPYATPHASDSAYNEFLSVFENHWDLPYEVIPGNHDCPIENYLKYFPDSLDRIVSFKGVTLILLASAYYGHNKNTGWNIGRIRYEFLEYLKKQLPNLSKPIFVFSHHALMDVTDLLSDGTITAVYWDGKASLVSSIEYVKNNYWVVYNAKNIQDILGSYPQGVFNFHLFQFTSEGYKTINNIPYFYKKHFIKDSDGTVYTVWYLDVDLDNKSFTVTSHDIASNTDTSIYSGSWT